MRKRQPDVLRARIADARERLAELLVRRAPIAELEALAHELDVLQGLARQGWRRRSLAWAAGGAAIAIMIAVVLHSLLLRKADVALVAKTRAFTIVNGAATSNVLPMSVAAHDVLTSVGSVRHDWCLGTRIPRPPACEPASALRVNALYLNTKATAQARITGSCFEIQMFHGGGEVHLTLVRESAGPPAARPHVDFPTYELGAGDWVRFCPDTEAVIQLDGLASMTVGERWYGALAERQDDPALSQATLSIIDTAQSVELRRTDVPWLGGLSEGVVVARLHDPIEITLVGNATRIGVGTGPHQRSMMPSWLDRLRSGPEFRVALAVLTAILGAAVAFRERLLGEIG